MVLFLIGAGPLYWRLYLGNPMLTDGLYDFLFAVRVDSYGITRLSLMTIGITWGTALLYYYIIDSVHFDRWYHWCIVALILVIITPLIGYRIVESSLDKVTAGLSIEYRDLNMLLQVWTAVLTLIWFVVASFSIRWWSRNCRHTPLPQ